MKNEFLIQNDRREAIDAVLENADEIYFYWNEIHGSNYLTLKMELVVDKSDEEKAKVLDKLRTEISMLDEKIITLICESSRFYNLELYPKINEFERKLRKLLYFVKAVSPEFGFDLLLENVDFGEIYKLLFVSDDYCKKAAKIAGKQNLSKKDLISQLSQLREEVLWDRVFINTKLPTVRDFLTIKGIRNNVMHAHNISHDDFLGARITLDQAIIELDEEISRVQINPASELNCDAIDELNTSFLNINKSNNNYFGFMDLLEIQGILITEFSNSALARAAKEMPIAENSAIACAAKEMPIAENFAFVRAAKEIPIAENSAFVRAAKEMKVINSEENIDD